ncbi:MAG: hypothetical protein ACI8ZN_001792 [Bacteroidia bacterium]
MFVSGFSFVKNAVKLDYPVVEAIQSILPLVDEMVVAVGKSEDDTRAVIAALGPKIRIIDTVWDESLRSGGGVLAIETNKAFDAVSEQADWCVYIQADECLHEKYVDEVRQYMLDNLSDLQIDGLLFGYKHFYGSYDYLGDSRTWYQQEIRVVRNNKKIRSWKDAQGFRKEGKKLYVKRMKAEMYHYGWVRHPKYMMAKSVEANKYWHNDQWIEERFDPDKEFDYAQIDSLKLFVGSHPKVMETRIEKANWKFSHDPAQKKFGFKTALLYWIEKHTGYRIGEHKNYIEV